MFYFFVHLLLFVWITQSAMVRVLLDRTNLDRATTPQTGCVQVYLRF